MRFQDRAVVVTGGSKGIGEGCSRVFCREGGWVAILARGREAGEALASELTETGPGRAVFFQCDVGEHRQLHRAIESTVDAFGRLDCMINNAGVHPPATSIDEPLHASLSWKTPCRTCAKRGAQSSICLR